MKTRSRTCFTTLVLTLALGSLALLAGAADDKSIVNPTGTWKVTATSTNTQTRSAAQTLKLKLNGNTLTGTLTYNSSPTVNGKASVAELPITDRLSS